MRWRDCGDGEQMNWGNNSGLGEERNGKRREKGGKGEERYLELNGMLERGQWKSKLAGYHQRIHHI